MKRSILVAVGASILLSGCLVKKSDYEEEQAAHAATKKAMAELQEQHQLSQEKNKRNDKNLKIVRGELATARVNLSRSRSALDIAKKEAAELKLTVASTTEASADLEAQLEASELKVSRAKDMFIERFRELQEKAEAELAAANAENMKLRAFMLSNFSKADFHAPIESSAAVVVEKEAALAEPVVEAPAVEEIPAVEEAPVEVPAAEVVAEEVVEEQAAAPQKKGWWKFWKKSEEVAMPKVVDLDVFDAALKAGDRETAAREAMRLVGQSSDEQAAVSLSNELMVAALMVDDLETIKWVSAGLFKGAGEQLSVVSAAISQSVKDTAYEAEITELLGL